MSEFDVVLKSCNIVDGSGKSTFKGSIGIKGEKIAVVGDVKGDAAIEINGSGLVACPGFVDPHSHADTTISRYPLADNLVMQGVTMFLGGNCGSTPAPLNKVVQSRYVFADLWWREVEPSKPIPDFLPLDLMDKYSDAIKKKLGYAIDWRTFDEWLSKVEKIGISINYAPLAGHATIRTSVMGEDWKRRATEKEIEEMKRYVEEAMLSGAFGISSFFDPSPGEYAAIEEIIELAKIASKYGGLYSPHTRNHQNNWYTEDWKEHGYGINHQPPGEVIAGRYHGLLEAIEVIRIANLPLLIAHFTPAYLTPQPTPEFLQEAIGKATIEETIDKARKEGLKVHYNAIAYSASIGYQGPMIESFFSQRLALPDWLKKMKEEEFIEQLKDKAFREKVKKFIYSGRFKFKMIHPLTDPYWTDCFKIIRCKNIEYVGKTIGEIARKRCPDHIIKAVYDESIETLFDILMEDPDTTWADILDKREYPGALRVFFKHPAGMPCTDCSALPAAPPTRFVRGHTVYTAPITYGLYPHYIDKFVKEERVLSLEEAIYHATYLPAQEVLGLKDRGIITPGAYADIVLFDFQKIRMAGDFMNPNTPPEGIVNVLVNGKIVYDKMKHTGARPGKVIRHKPKTN